MKSIVEQLRLMRVPSKPRLREPTLSTRTIRCPSCDLKGQVKTKYYTQFSRKKAKRWHEHKCRNCGYMWKHKSMR